MRYPKACACVICGSHELTQARAPNHLGHLLRCQTCGHTMVSPESSIYVENRRNQIESFGDAFTTGAPPLADFYQRINAVRTEDILALNGSQRILEVGPGLGAVMAHMKAAGHNVLGLDLSEFVRDAIYRKYGLQVLIEELSEYSRRSAEQWDAAIMRHVLEHFENPVAALQCVAHLLRAGGKLYVAVPNMNSWHRRWHGWSGYQTYHLHYFEADSLARALQRASFDVERIGSYESLTGWANTLSRSLGRRRRTFDEDLDAHSHSAPSWARVALDTCRLGVGVGSTPLRLLQGALGKGEELYALAVKAA